MTSRLESLLCVVVYTIRWGWNKTFDRQYLPLGTATKYDYI